MKLTFFYSLLFLTFFSFGQTLKIVVSGIRSASGTIRIAFYANSKSFDDEKPLFIKTEAKTGIVNGMLHISYPELKTGVYGLAILDDENSNQKMDYGFFLPKEGFGFSDYYHSGMSRPKFESFDFTYVQQNLCNTL